eukprot:scaffold19947_cov58-Phaeocystis_antarctica.AAC.2
MAACRASESCHVSRAAARLRVVSGVTLPRQRRRQRQRLDHRLQRRVVEKGHGEAGDGGGEHAVRRGEEIAAARHLRHLAQVDHYPLRPERRHRGPLATREGLQPTRLVLRKGRTWWLRWPRLGGGVAVGWRLYDGGVAVAWRWGASGAAAAAAAAPGATS